jgi:hypothetical protein
LQTGFCIPLFQARTSAIRTGAFVAKRHGKRKTKGILGIIKAPQLAQSS